ncbi:MAG: phospholipase D family protein, partial [Bacteroidaceae bacterium]
MKLISSSRALEKEFLRLLNQYKEYYWLSAWAGVNTKAFEKLDENRDRIKKLVIGIHFYQTHPDFIKAFLDEDSVHYVMQPEGIFHPKLYLFYTSPEEWEVITGSANFTNSAFTKNTEISTLITSEEPNADKLLKQIMGLVDSNWSTESNFSSEQYKNYKTTWQNQKRKLKSISGNYHESHRKTPTPAFEVPIMNMPWEEFCKKIQDKEGGGLENRLSLLDYVQKLFKENNSFADLSLEDRCII